jgi:hypothetical protein
VLALVPGVDGVGRGADGKLRYFVLDDTLMGSMADKTVIEVDRSLVLPRDVDPIAIAAAMNPAMGPWLALRCRVPFKKRQNVLVLGATGNAGSMAVQVAKHLGAAQIIAAGRDQERLATLPALGATDIVMLDDAGLGSLARDVDVVLDFVWAKERRGPWSPWSASAPIAAAPSPGSRSARSPGRRPRFLPPPCAPRAFRSSAAGSARWPGRDIVGELPALVKEIVRGTFSIAAKAMSLSDVEQAWAEATHTNERIVLTP